ncbi:LuxR family transcriptional regulator [Labedella phragmitis]|uniref:LuxR family transcriptional regulator n=1 Tax=Labedella phragmitis TaxID=2498849 RepID=A0A3S3ZT30_9MICO|nr:LuxR family transcriptional regulator [Labedella phragmitis]RWZ53076.1 LuxR family transcriptional regulator [Labedella phragmitis]
MSHSGVFGVPRVAPDLVPRPALEQRLDDDAMITTIDAGAGFGKTTLLSSWASTHDGPGVWVDGSIGRGDRASFWNNVFAVVTQAAARTDSAVLREAVVPDGPLGGDADVSAAVAAFARSLTGPFVLIIDTAEAVDLDAIAEDLVAVVRFATASHLYVADRRRRFRPTLMASDVTESRLTSDDLRFSVEETARLVGYRSAARVAPENVHRLAGGVAGLATRIAASSVKDPAGGPEARELLQPWIAEVGSLVEEDLATAASGAPPPVRSGAVSAALMIAALATMRVAEAADLVGWSEEIVVTLLDAAADRGIGSWIDTFEGERFAFAPIVSLAARRELVHDMDAPARRSTAARFAQLFARRGDALSAFGLALDAEDFDLATAIGKRSFLVLTRDDTPGLLRRLKRIPLARLRRHPLLVLFIAILHMQSSRGHAAAMLHFRLAEQLARASEASSSADDRAVMIGVRSATTRMQGRFDKAVPTAREFLERFDRLSVDEQDRLSSLSRHFLWQVAHTLLFAGDIRGGVGAAQRMLAVPVPPDLGEDRGIHPALTLAAAAQAIEGSMLLSTETLAEAMTHPPRQSAFHHVWETTAVALAAIERGEFAAARALVDELDHDLANGEYWPIDLVVRLMDDVGDGRLDSAIERAETVLMANAPPRQATATRDVMFVLLGLLSLAGRPTRTAQKVLRNVSRPGPLLWLADAMVALHDGDALKAAGLTRNVLGDGSASPRTRAGALLVRAAALAAAGQEEAAARPANSAFALLDASGLTTPWLLLGARQRADVVRIVGDETIPAGLLDALDRMPVVFGAAGRIERLTPREQEVLAQLVAGATVAEVAKASGVSPNTVKTQRARVYRKLGVDNRADAARAAVEHDLL